MNLKTIFWSVILLTLLALWNCGGGGGGGGSLQGPAETGDRGGGGEGGGTDGGSGYGDSDFEVSRGPYGGDRFNVVIDPLDPNHIITDSCDQSGIWLSEDGGEEWRRCSPQGSAFERANTLIALMRGSEGGPDEILVGIADEHEATSAFWKVPLRSPDVEAAQELPGVVSRIKRLTVDPHPSRPGRIAAVSFSLANLLEVSLGNIVFSSDRGATWSRWYAGSRYHAVLDLCFAHGGERLLIASAGSLSVTDLNLLYEDEGTDGVLEVIYSLESNVPIRPDWVARYSIDEVPCVVVADPQTGALVEPYTLLTGSRVQAFAMDPGLENVIWFAHSLGLARSVSNGMTAEDVQMALTGSRSGFITPMKHQGITVLDDPGSGGEETVFLSLGGGLSWNRGIFKLQYDVESSLWQAERVSPGPSTRFQEYPKGPVCAAPSDGRRLYAPYCQDSILRSDNFGEIETWTVAKKGLTGVNVFGVVEDPSDSSVVMVTGQNVIRRNNNRIANSEWLPFVIQQDQVTANLRAGAIVDPEDSNRWLVAGGAGAGVNLNGGAWLTNDGGYTWERTLGSNENQETNPQVYAIAQHPEYPELVAAASGLWCGHGTAGVFASLERGAAGSFVQVLGDGAYGALAALEIPGEAGTILAGGEAGLALLTISAGGEVEAMKLAWENGAIAALAWDGTTVYAGTAEGKIFSIEDDSLREPGAWYELDDIGCEITALAVSSARPGEIYAGTTENGIFRSLDGGGVFDLFASGLESSEQKVFCLLISSRGDRLYAGTLGGLAVRKLD